MVGIGDAGFQPFQFLVLALSLSYPSVHGNSMLLDRSFGFEIYVCLNFGRETLEDADFACFAKYTPAISRAQE